MTAWLQTVQENSALSSAARERLHSLRGEPLFIADWVRAVFIHFEVDPEALRREVPFALDLRDGRAFVSLVAFTMRRMRPRLGGALGAWLFRPFAESRFLNIRTYVRDGGEPGIYFLAEWLSNGGSVPLGPRMFGLPYRAGRLDYDHAHERGTVRGRVGCAENGASLAYRGRLAADVEFQSCEAGTLEEFLVERYTAFTRYWGRNRFFRVWHPPWPLTPMEIEMEDMSLLTKNWTWFHDARLVSAHYSPGVERVEMGWPHRLEKLPRTSRLFASGILR